MKNALIVWDGKQNVVVISDGSKLGISTATAALWIALDCWLRGRADRAVRPTSWPTRKTDRRSRSLNRRPRSVADTTKRVGSAG